MKQASPVILLAACLALAACGEKREPGPADETVFKEQVRALDKARTVEDEAEARKRELDRRVDEESGGY
jgi:hypothetical protein